jgi:drug/metabolite transporter (DMT)-like permease
MKIAGTCFEPFTIATGRVFISALTLGGYCYYKKSFWWPKSKEITPLLVVIILGFCFPFAMQPFLVNLYGSGYVGMMLAFLPLFTLVLSRIILKTKITGRQFFGILGGLFFTYLLFHASLDLEITPFGFLISLTVPIAYTFSNILIKRDFPQLNPIAFTATSAFIAGLLTLPFAINNFSIHNQSHLYISIGSIIILGVFMSGLALALFYHVIQQSGPLMASLTNYIVPIFALFWGWFDAEKTTPLQIIGIAGIFVMLYITQPIIKAKLTAQN